MSTNIKVYTAGTPNGHKIHFALEELGLNYEVHKIDISKNTQKEPWFLEINPNGRIPAIVDHTVSPPLRVFEGGAILQYLTTRYDKDHKISFPFDSAEYWETLSWLTWMQSGIGPMQGQANHFHRYAPEKIPYAINRYQTETKRLYSVLEDRLQKEGQWIVGGKYSIADIACFSWVEWHRWAGVEIDNFPKIQEWKERIEQRDATEKGLNVPDKFELREAMRSKEGEEAYAKHHSGWVMKGQEADQSKHK
ncbi:Glutathione S-transferase-like protein 19 [Elsinoe fawcettii]|nr:Glutathione S-transferase-like protein 19 [Elsinoe fawcettii]